jgi:glycosyltransferase involved in cell wall biosynthesis
MFMISVVVPTHNRKDQLKSCLESLLIQTHKDFEAIVVDDGSTDGTRSVVERLQKSDKRIRYFRQSNRGHSIARNLGFSKAVGDVIASTDDDCVVRESWLGQMEAGLRDHPGIAAIGGSVSNPSEGRLSRAHYILAFSSWLPGMKKRFVKNIPTCNIAYSRQAINGLEFEDDQKRLGYRDSLFNLEAVKRGRILFEPSLVVDHYRWHSTGSVSEFLKAQERQGLGFYHKGYLAHGIVGRVLRRLYPINMLCPRLVLVFLRCLKYGHASRFLLNLPLIVRGEHQRYRVSHA